MTDVIGRGVIEVSADSSKLNASINEARRSIKSLGDDAGNVSKKQSASIDRYVKGLQTAAAVQGKSTRETELYKLALKGASDEQLRAANSALRLSDAYAKGQAIGDQVRAGLLKIGAAASIGIAAAAVSFELLIKKAGDFQDLAEKTGDTAQNIASLAVAAAVGGTSIEAVAAASTKLAKNLTGVDDESKAAGAAIAALGLNLENFKKQAPADRLEAIAKALNGFEEGPEKGAVAMALLGKAGADLLPFLKELGAEGGRQVILTQAQIKLADEYIDKQTKLRAQISLYAQAIAVQALPAINDLTGAIKDSIAELAGLDKSSSNLSNSHAISDFANEAVIVLAQVADSALLTARAIGIVIASVGQAIEDVKVLATAAKVVSPNPVVAIQGATEFKAQLDERNKALDAYNVKLANFLNGSTTTLEDNVRARIARTRKDSGRDISTAADLANFDRAQIGDSTPKKKLAFDGAEKKSGKDTAAQEAKAQLASDLSEIRKAQEALTNTIGNGEKIVDAQRSANLISEADYYQKKREFLQTNDAINESFIEREIARLQKENLSGKDRIDNDRKIAEAQAKLAKAREDAATNLEVLGIREKNALDSIARAYADAQSAAQNYLDTVSRAAAREVAGVGAGNKAREVSGSISQIEEKFEAQRQALQRDNRNGKFAGREGDFQRELALVNSTQEAEIAINKAKFAKLDELQKDWLNGATEALHNYGDEARNVAKQTEEVFAHALQGVEDQLTNLFTGKKFDINALIGSIAADGARITAKQLTGSFADLVGGAIGTSKTGSADSSISSLSMSANSGSLALNQLAIAAQGAASALGGSQVSSTSNSGGSWLDSFLGLFGSSNYSANGGVGYSNAAGISGGRAGGGALNPNAIHPVNERRVPEVLTTGGGKQYLMPLPQGGTVGPNSGESKPPVIFNNYQSFAPGTNRQTTGQAAVQAAGLLRRAQRDM